MSFFVQNPTYKLVFSKVLIREHSYLILENLHIHFAKFLVYLVAINITILVRFYPLFDPTKRLVLGEKLTACLLLSLIAMNNDSPLLKQW